MPRPCDRDCGRDAVGCIAYPPSYGLFCLECEREFRKRAAVLLDAFVAEKAIRCRDCEHRAVDESGRHVCRAPGVEADPPVSLDTAGDCSLGKRKGGG